MTKTYLHSTPTTVGTTKHSYQYNQIVVLNKFKLKFFRNNHIPNNIIYIIKHEFNAIIHALDLSLTNVIFHKIEMRLIKNVFNLNVLFSIQNAHYIITVVNHVQQ